MSRNNNSGLPRAAVAGIALIVLAVVSPARGVIISTGDGSGNTEPPASDPGWNNVGDRGSGSAVYLGERWVITAEHIGAGEVTFPVGRFDMEADTAVQLKNPSGRGLSQFTDLLMFRLDQDPGLPSLTLPTNPPQVDQHVVMIGAGRTREPEMTAWDVQFNFNRREYVWTKTSGWGGVHGYHVDGAKVMRWGTNLVVDDFEADGDHNWIVNVENGDVISMATRFDEESFLTTQAQATEGDSGGAVFQHTGDQWELAGIMHGTQPLPNQPEFTVTFNSLTFFADTWQYRDQINAIMTSFEPTNPWQNPADPLDVNDDSHVSPIDALLVINHLNDTGPGPLAIPPVAPNIPPPFLDTDGDGVVAPIDALIVINTLNARSGEAEGVPEPSAVVLAVVGLIGLLIFSVRNRATRPTGVDSPHRSATATGS